MVFPNESSLIARLRFADKSAVEIWYKLSSPLLLAFFSSRVRVDADAQELVHDTLLSTLDALPLFQGSEQGKLWGFMLGIARHELADYWRKTYAKRVLKALPFGQELLDSLSHDRPEMSIASGVLAMLPADIAELLELKYIDGFSLVECAEKFGVSVACIQSRLHRARKMFSEQYAEIEGIQ